MGIGFWKERIACPQDEIGERDVENGHELILAIIQFEHVTKLCLKIE
jgi:hypothetical protein